MLQAEARRVQIRAVLGAGPHDEGSHQIHERHPVGAEQDFFDRHWIFERLAGVLVGKQDVPQPGSVSLGDVACDFPLIGGVARFQDFGELVGI